MTSSSSKPLSQYKREPDRVSFQLTDRDVDILKALNRYRYMRTSHIHDLLFPENSGSQSARRRLRNLYHHRYIARAQPYVQVGKAKPEITYFLDQKGRQVLREHDETVRYWRKGSEVKYLFLNHALALTTFRIKFEKAVAAIEGATIDRFIPDFDMRAEAEKYIGKNRYTLYSEVLNPANRKTYTVHPDALIQLTIARDGKSATRLIFVEIDQGTQALERIREKVTGYWLYQEQKLFEQFGMFSSFLVLFEAPTQRRADTLFNGLLDHIGAGFVRVAAAPSLSSESLLTQPVWKGMNGEMKSVVIQK